MHIEKLSYETSQQEWFLIQRPQSFEEFIGQEHIIRIVKTAIHSSQKNEHQLWHILLAWPSWYGKTTLAHIISLTYSQKLHVVTAYAISKPADLISILTSLDRGDVLFIDEIHRLKPAIEEMLYIAMEDYAIDMIMWDGWAVRVPLQPFTLIWATTKPESLSEPLKNRFVYNFHCIDYSETEKRMIIEKYLHLYGIQYDKKIVPLISRKVDTVPRRIHNFVVTVRDYLVSRHNTLDLTADTRLKCDERLNVKDGGLTTIHQQYLKILQLEKNKPLWLKTIALKLGINEQSVENEIEPLLLKQWLIEKTGRGRIISS